MILQNNPSYNLYYSDTDSIYIDKPLPDHLIGEGLGLMKLENKIKRAIFLAPKVYGYITKDGAETVKIKGLPRNTISLKDLEDLLQENAKRELNIDKWYKNLSLGEIHIKNQIYTLKITDNKRNLLYDFMGRLIKTTPKLIKDFKEISKS